MSYTRSPSKSSLASVSELVSERKGGASKSADHGYVVGRTGSGKSSLTLALLRLILTEGKVYYDGIATDSVNLDALRSHITIIPQVVRVMAQPFAE